MGTIILDPLTMVRDEVKTKLAHYKPKYQAVKDDFLRVKSFENRLSEDSKNEILELSKAPLNYMKEHFLLLTKFSNGGSITEEDLKRIRTASALADRMYKIASSPSLRKMNKKLTNNDFELLQLMSMISNDNFADQEFDTLIAKYFFTS